MAEDFGAPCPGAGSRERSKLSGPPRCSVFRSPHHHGLPTVVGRGREVDRGALLDLGRCGGQGLDLGRCGGQGEQLAGLLAVLAGGFDDVVHHSHPDGRLFLLRGV